MSQHFGSDPWQLLESSLNRETMAASASIFSIGNGYIGARGGFEELPGGNPSNAVFIHGFYGSEPIVYAENAYGYAKKRQTILPVANPLRVDIWLGDERFDLGSGQIRAYSRTLDMKRGVLNRAVDWESPSGVRAKISFQRFACLDQPELLYSRITVELAQPSVQVKIVSSIDPARELPAASNDSRAATALGACAIRVTAQGSFPDGARFLAQHSPGSGLSAGVVLCHSAVHLDPQPDSDAGVFIGESNSCFFQLDKIAALARYEGPCGEGELELLAEIARRGRSRGYRAAYQDHAAQMERFWEESDLQLEGSLAIQQSIRLACCQIFFSVGRDGKTGLSAKGLTGTGYDGHCFWDTEIYALPFLTYTQPQIARQVLLYRYYTLPKAVERARELGYSAGALYAWRTINGEECSPYFPAGTAQYHINADIAYAVNQYAAVTGDHEFIYQYGLEILVETARFWLLLGFYNPAKDDQFCINCVTGPDEYTALVNNNCYTNIMAKANLQYAVKWLSQMAREAPAEYRKFLSQMHLEQAEVSSWTYAADHMYLPYSEEQDLYLQDDEQEQRIPWPIEQIPSSQFPLLLHFHPLEIYRHLICKQADVLLAMLLQEESFTKRQIAAALDYYEKITTHDSSLSCAVFSIIACSVGDTQKAEAFLTRIAFCDLYDLTGTTSEGLHMANMGGIWLSLVYGFAGLRVTASGLSFSPVCPKICGGFSFCLKYLGRKLKVHIAADQTEITLLQGDPLTVQVNGEPVLLTVQ